MALSINLQGDDAPNDEKGEGEKVGDSEGEAEEYAEDTAPVGRVLAVSTTTMYLRAQNICLLFLPLRMCLGAELRLTRDSHVKCAGYWTVVMVRPNAHEVKPCAPEASCKNQEPQACKLILFRRA